MNAFWRTADRVHTYVLPTEILWTVGPYGEYPQLRPFTWQYTDGSELSSVLPALYWYQLLICYTASILITITMTHYYYCYYGSRLKHYYTKYFVKNKKKKNCKIKFLELFHTKEKHLQFRVLDSKRKEIQNNSITTKILEHNSSLFFNEKSTSNCGCIITLFIENTHCVFCRKVQF